MNGFQYYQAVGKGNQSVLQFFPTAEGYVNVTGGTAFNYVYNYTDHLGNVRLSYQKESNGTLKVLEENNYYPFGLKHTGYNNTNVANPNYKYKYNGKELQDEFNINLYDYGARNYDPAIGRWFNIDPLAEKFQELSPYNYAVNNPVIFIDPDGKSPIIGAVLNAFTEYASIVGSKMVFEDMSFTQANKSLTWQDGLDIGIAAGFGAASGAIDGGVTNFAKWAANPRNQKIIVKLLEVGVGALESSLKEIYKDGDFNLGSVLSGALAEVGLGSLMKHGEYKKVADQASNKASVYEKKAVELSSRKSPNNKLINNAQQKAQAETKKAKSFKKLDSSGQVINWTILKATGSKVQNETKKQK